MDDLTLLNTEVLPAFKYGRGVIFDILCTSTTEEQFIVEIQNTKQPYAKDRFVFYTSRAIYQQGQRGEDWRFDLVPVYGVFLLNFKMTDEESCLRRDIALTDMRTGQQFSDKMRLIFLELPYFTKEENECETNFERWLYVLNNMETLERMPFLAQKAAFEKLMKVANIANFTPKELQEHESSLDTYRVMVGAMEQSEATGEEKGREEGREEEKREMARKMKTKGIDVCEIADITGLSTGEIERL